MVAVVKYVYMATGMVVVIWSMVEEYTIPVVHLEEEEAV